MSKFHFKTLETEQDKNHFLVRFSHYVHVHLPEVYAKQAKFTACMLGDEMVGGYMLVHGPIFRSLMFVPDEVKNGHPLLSQGLDGDFVEVNGVWMKEEFRGSKLVFQLWMEVRRDILRSKISYLLLMFNSKAINLGALYKNTLSPKLLYKGAPTHIAGSGGTHDEIQVCTVSRFDLRVSVFRGFKEFTVRRLGIMRRKAAISKPSYERAGS